MLPTDRDFRTMAQANRTGILVHDAKTKAILWANEAACAIFGFTLEELLPLKAHHMSSPEKSFRRAIGVGWLQEAVDKGSSRRQWKYLSKDGRPFLTDAEATAVEFDCGSVIMVQFNILNESDTETAAPDLSSASVNRVLALTGATTIVLDNAYRIDHCSPTATEVLGQPEDRLIGQKIWEIGECTPKLELESIQRRVEQSEIPVELYIRSETANGEDKYLKGFLENHEHDGLVSKLVILRDWTASRRLEEERAYHQAELHYQSRYKAMGDMALLLAHELGQPLSAARNYATALPYRLPTNQPLQDVRNGLHHIEKQLERASSIVASARNYVKRIESSISAADLNGIVEESLYFIRLKARDLNIAVRVDLTKEPLPVEVDKTLIGQVILNLCFNALEEVSHPAVQSKAITISTGSLDSIVWCEVGDYGRGLKRDAEDSLARGAFSAKDGGAGIGLIVSEQIMDRHQGRITYMLRDPQGTIARMELPRTVDDLNL